MATLIKKDSFGDAWKALLSEILSNGKPVSPRDQETKELMNVAIEVVYGLDNVLLSPARNLNYRFMVAEWLWILAGFNDVESLARYNRIMRQFSDDGQILSGAYGPRLLHQWAYIGDTLQKKDSRQAVATIWTPNPKSSKDIPCTISLQWLIRDDHLHCTANMRSSDIWLGLPYDFFTFSQLTNCLSGFLGLPVGTVTMNLASSHLYSRDYDIAIVALNGHWGTLNSPQIRDSIHQPTVMQIKEILEQTENVESSLHYPFNRYKESLEQDKEYALKVLREISEL